MEINIIENNNLLNMIYINTNEEVSNNKFIKTISGIVTKNNFLDDANYYTINNLTKNNTLKCFEVVSKDKSEVLLNFEGLSLENISNSKRLRLKNLNEDSVYVNLETKEVFSGGALMYYGVNIKKLFQNSSSNTIHLKML
ncbi:MULTISPECIES: GH36 C-terminal domain-containing protein [Clostridia]|uniref:GH36 C-terminal domain-containing protein n=1 Tax=Clostridium saudiense TaxID=1414720 RepID=A0ABS2FGR9_9CLOT|nr:MULTISPECIES: GH36 C-terminal domain-containing protein [Clostridiaceae]MBM6819212.1 GH36 C-terminal domain-containing protein [Clostridium saudiense]